MIKVSFFLLPPVWPNLPPLGISYLKSNLKVDNVDVNLYDINILLYNFLKKNNIYPHIYKNWTIGDYKASQNLLKILDRIKNNGFDIYKILNEYMVDSDVIGFSIFSSNLYIILNYLQKIKEKNSDKIFIAGGPEVTLSYISNDLEKFNDFDYLFIGESEKTFNDFLTLIKRENIDDNVNRKIDGDKINSKNKKFDKGTGKYKNYINIVNNQKIFNGYINKYEINTIKFPDYTQFDLKKYLRKNALPIFSSRGCIGKCNFCTERLLFEKIRIRDAENIVNEIEYFYNNYSTKWFTFFDSMVNANLKIFELWMKMIIEKKINIKWDAQILIRKMSENIFKLMKESGNINLFIGLESGSNKVLKLMGKLFNINDAVQFFKRLDKYDLFFEVSLIVGYPGETDKDFYETLNFLEINRKYIKKIAQINKFVPYKALNISLFSKYLNNKDYEKVVNERFNILKEHIKKLGYKYTEKYIGNL